MSDIARAVMSAVLEHPEARAALVLRLAELEAETRCFTLSQAAAQMGVTRPTAKKHLPAAAITGANPLYSLADIRRAIKATRKCK